MGDLMAKVKLKLLKLGINYVQLLMLNKKKTLILTIYSLLIVKFQNIKKLENMSSLNSLIQGKPNFH